MTLGEMIQQFREKTHMSQRKFAEISGLSNAYISMLEKGKNPNTEGPINVSLDSLRAIAETMGTTVHELLENLDEAIPIDFNTADNLYSEMLRLWNKSSTAQKRAVIDVLKVFHKELEGQK